MDSFASLALATEQPTDALLERKPYGRTKPLVSLSMMRHILGHSLYQLIVMFVLTFHGHVLFDIPYGFGLPHSAPPTQHLTMVFNTFVMMQIFNEINSRKVHGERNIFSGILRNHLFLAILFGTVAIQVISTTFLPLMYRVQGGNQNYAFILLFNSFYHYLYSYYSIIYINICENVTTGSKLIVFPLAIIERGHIKNLYGLRVR